MKSPMRALALATQLGVTMGLITVITVLGSLFVGSWVDRQLGTRPLATLLFILMGVLAGLLGTVHLAQSSIRELNAAAAQQAEARTSFSARDLGRTFLLILELILVTLVPIGLGLWAGLYLDRVTGSGLVFTIVLATLSIIAALAGVYLVTSRAVRRARGNS